MEMSCQILSALPLEDHSAQLSYGAAAHWCCSCSSHGGLITCPQRCLWQTKEKLIVLMGLNQAAPPDTSLAVIFLFNVYCWEDKTLTQSGLSAKKPQKTCILVYTQMSACISMWLFLSSAGISSEFSESASVNLLTGGCAHTLGCRTVAYIREKEWHTEVCSTERALMAYLHKGWILLLKWFTLPPAALKSVCVCVVGGVGVHPTVAGFVQLFWEWWAQAETWKQCLLCLTINRKTKDA